MYIKSKSRHFLILKNVILSYNITLYKILLLHKINLISILFSYSKHTILFSYILFLLLTECIQPNSKYEYMLKSFIEYRVVKGMGAVGPLSS